MKKLQAGPASVVYENGFLRRISYRDTEIVRMIYFALRDHNWNTLDHRIENESILLGGDNFEITYDCTHSNGGVPVMTWKGKIRGSADGGITFEIDGLAIENFRKNRAGFCVLHPLNVLGIDCTIGHPDGSQVKHTFPRQIAAENPFKDIQTMEWEVASLPYSLSFEGDIFETEDQRNWGDASFKTFCTPLDKPFPVELKKGQKVFQRIIFKPVKALQTGYAAPPHITLQEGANVILPLVGIGASTEQQRLSDQVSAAIRDLRLSHYRLDLYPGSDSFSKDFSDGYENAYGAGLPLEVVLHLTENFAEEIEAFSVLSLQNKVRTKKVLLLQNNRLVTGQQIIDQVRSLKKALPGVLFGAGTNYNFNEINKNHFTPAGLDFISFSMDPQEHAFDDLTILENTASLEHLVHSAKSIYGKEMPVHISPLALRKRFNPYATNPADLFLDEAKKADPRQRERFASVFTFASLASLAKGGAMAVTLYQTAGNQGIMTGTGERYPVYETLRKLSPYLGKRVTVLESSDPLSVVAISLNAKTLAICNLADEPKGVRWNDRDYSIGPRELRFEASDRA